MPEYMPKEARCQEDRGINAINELGNYRRNLFNKIAVIIFTVSNAVATGEEDILPTIA